MKKAFNIEYTNLSNIFLLLVAKLLIYVALIFLLLLVKHFFQIHIESFIFVLLIVGVVEYFYYKYKKRIANKTKVLIDNDGFEIGTKKIKYQDIAKYRIDRMIRTDLILWLKNNEKYKISAHSWFCDTSGFNKMCNELEKHFKASGNTRIEKQKTFMESKVWYYTVRVFRYVFILLTIYAIIVRKTIPLSVFPALIGLYILETSVQYQKPGK